MLQKNSALGGSSKGEADPSVLARGPCHAYMLTCLEGLGAPPLGVAEGVPAGLAGVPATGQAAGWCYPRAGVPGGLGPFQQ